MKPFVTLVEDGGNAQAVAAKERAVPGIVGATVPPGPGWHRGQDTLVEAFPAVDGAAPGIQGVIDRANSALNGTSGTLGGVPAVDRDFVHAVYGNFAYVLAFVLVLTLVLLTRAFRSIVLAIKAAILNLISLGAAYGIIVFIFQKGHGSSLWNINATGAVTAWIPLMIFAFLYRPLDGLRGLHAHADARGVRRDALDRTARSSSASLVPASSSRARRSSSCSRSSSSRRARATRSRCSGWGSRPGSSSTRR